MPASEIVAALSAEPPGRALDLACGRGRHSIWLRDRGWAVTAVDQIVEPMDGVTVVKADLERGEYNVQPQTWDLIICWLYWQEDLLPAIAVGVRDGGTVALAGKTSGRFATSLERYQAAFAGWEEIAAGTDEYKTFFIARSGSKNSSTSRRISLAS